MVDAPYEQLPYLLHRACRDVRLLDHGEDEPLLLSLSLSEHGIPGDGHQRVGFGVVACVAVQLAILVNRGREELMKAALKGACGTSFRAEARTENRPCETLERQLAIRFTHIALLAWAPSAFSCTWRGLSLPNGQSLTFSGLSVDVKRKLRHRPLYDQGQRQQVFEYHLSDQCRQRSSVWRVSFGSRAKSDAHDPQWPPTQHHSRHTPENHSKENEVRMAGECVSLPRERCRNRNVSRRRVGNDGGDPAHV